MNALYLILAAVATAVFYRTVRPARHSKPRAEDPDLEPYHPPVERVRKAAPRACPYCRAAFPEKPAKPRKCRACGETIAYRDHVPMTVEQARAVDREGFAQQYREARAQVLADLKRDRADSIVKGYKIEAGSDCCSYCFKLRNKVVPLTLCTPEMLPPFPMDRCEYEDGCQAWYSAVLK